MKLPPEAIEEFRELWVQEFGIQLENDVAEHYAKLLIGILSVKKNKHELI